MCSKDFWYASVDINVIRDKKTAKFIFTVLCSFAGWSYRGCWPRNLTRNNLTKKFAPPKIISELKFKKTKEAGISHILATNHKKVKSPLLLEK